MLPALTPLMTAVSVMTRKIFPLRQVTLHSHPAYLVVSSSYSWKSSSRLSCSLPCAEQVTYGKKIFFKSPKMLIVLRGILHETAGALWLPLAWSIPPMGSQSHQNFWKKLILIPNVYLCLRDVNKPKNPFHKDPTWNSVTLIFVVFVFCGCGGF